MEPRGRKIALSVAMLVLALICFMAWRNGNDIREALAFTAKIETKGRQLPLFA